MGAKAVLQCGLAARSGGVVRARWGWRSGREEREKGRKEVG
jgi:hypothetical protein